MSDITTQWAGTHGDYVLIADGIHPSYLLSSNDLVTSAIISLFSDRVAAIDDVIADYSNDPRGWWGDAGEDYPIGSRFWQLRRHKLTQSTATLAVGFAQEALQWMIDDGVVSNIDISFEIVGTNQLSLLIVFKRDGSPDLAQKFLWVWSSLN